MTATNGIRSKRSKHIDVVKLYVLQAVEEGVLTLEKVSSAENLAAFLTKPLGPQKFIPLIKLLGMEVNRRQEPRRRVKKGVL